MEIEYDKRDHAVDISSHHNEPVPTQANSVAVTSLTSACSLTSTGTDATPIPTLQPSIPKNNKHNNPGPNLLANDRKNRRRNGKEKLPCLGLPLIIIITLLVVISFLITSSLAIVFTSIIIPVIIICLVLGYWITCLHQSARCDDYADIDDTYDTELGSYWHHLILWMTQLTGVLLVELVVYLALFRIGPFPLKKLSVLHLPVWKWFLICIIFLVYFSLWCMTRLLLHKARERSSSEKVFLRIHVFSIYEGLLGVAIWGFYFLVEFFVFKLVPPLRRPKILGLYAHKWVHALVYVFIGVNVGRVLSASIVSLLQQQHKRDGKFDYSSDKDEDASKSILVEDTEEGFKNPSKILKFMGMGCKLIMSLLFRHFDTKKCIVYVVIGLRRSINFVFISIWLLVTWTSHFEHQLRPSKETVWVPRVGTITLICLLIFSLLWLLKNSIMLWWKYRSMYHKFYEEVLEAGTKLYLLGMICGQHLDVLVVGWRGGISENVNSNNKEEEKCNDMSRQKRISRVVAKARIILVHKLSIKDADGQKGDQSQLMQYQPGIYAIMRMVKYFLLAENVFKKDINASNHKLIKKWRHPHDQNSRTPLNNNHIKDAYGTNLSNADLDVLVGQIKREFPWVGQEVQVQDFERWLETSYRNCFNMVNTLASAKRLALYLNQVMVVIIIICMICIWLVMFTRSTKIVTLFTAPVLAVSFIFADTISTVFKGLIFSYVIHPYDIGDTCIIQDTLYEVKQIDFWKTTFLKVETNEVVFYPNSALFGESIINKKKKKGVVDTLDRVEFIFASNTDKQNIGKLTNEIDDYFLKEQSTKFQKQQVEVKYNIDGTRKHINLTIGFKHNLKDYPDVLRSERFQEMKRRKQELEDHIMRLCNDMKIEAPNKK